MDGETPRRVEATGSRGVVIGEYNTVFQYFGRAEPELSTRIRIAEFQPYVDERTEGFTGRAFAFEDIEQWLANPAFRSGYIMVKGKPGVGKTALLGQLVKRRGWVHHFNIARINLTSISAFLSNVCAQLIVRYGLDDSGWPPHATEDGGFLLSLLSKAASNPANRPVVVAVDALDEAEDPDSPQVNPLFLPSALPDGVFLVVSVRAEHRHANAFASRHTIDLDNDSRAWHDAPAYIRHFLHAEGAPMLAQVASWGMAEAEFITELANRSKGNFMYLTLVLKDIRDGLLNAENIDSIENLPDDLQKYYRIHWDIMRNRDLYRFLRFEEPVVCLLSTINEPVSVDELMYWTRQVWTVKKWDLSELTRRAIVDVLRQWGQFLNHVTVQGVLRYALYHESFRDFLDSEVGLSDYESAIVDATLAKIPDFRRG